MSEQILIIDGLGTSAGPARVERGIGESAVKRAVRGLDVDLV